VEPQGYAGFKLTQQTRIKRQLLLVRQYYFQIPSHRQQVHFHHTRFWTPLGVSRVVYVRSFPLALS